MYLICASMPINTARWSMTMNRLRRWHERMTSTALAALLLFGGWWLAARVHVTGGSHGSQTLTFRDVTLPVQQSTIAVPESKGASATTHSVLDRSLLAEESIVAPLPLNRRMRPAVPLRSTTTIAGGVAARTRVGGVLRRSTVRLGAGIELARSQRDSSGVRFKVDQLVLPEPTEPKTIASAESDVRRDSLTIELNEIMDWMRLAASELPPGIRQHVQPQSEDLTSQATFLHAGAVYEAYLMARVPLREIHIVLVRENQTFYLIDRSFQREGKSFRVGYARRSGGVITGVVSEERAAASPEARQFYRIFLGWWDEERLQL